MSKTLSLQNFLKDARTSQFAVPDAVPVNLIKKEFYQLTCPNLYNSIWSSNNMKIKCIKIKMKFEIFSEKHRPTRHIKYKVINFAPSNKPIMANKLASRNLERFV